MIDVMAIIILVIGLISATAGFYSMYLRKKANESWMDRAIIGMVGLSLFVYSSLKLIWGMQKLETTFLMIVAVLIIITCLFAYMENLQLRRYN